MSSPATSFHADSADAANGRKLLILALLLTALAYAATVRFDFVYDDGPQIVTNPTLASWKTLPALFTGHSWKFLAPGWGGNYYRPLFMSWLLVNHNLFGLSPLAFHATTVLVHLVVTWLCFIVSRPLLRNATNAGYVALLFGLHPVHVESVAWVSGVTEPLMAAFVLAAFWAWRKSADEPEHATLYKGLSLVFYAAGCLSKETAVLLPVVLVVHDLLFGEFSRGTKSIARAVWRTLPLWIIAAVYFVVRSMVLGGLMHSERTSASQVLMTVPIILWGYLRRLVWPFRLSVFYDTPPVTTPLDWRFWLPLVALVLASALVWRIAKRSRIAALALTWIFVFLAPAILGIPTFPVGEWIHDRYLYLSSFGFCLLLVHGISQLPSRRELFALPATPAGVVMCLSAVMALGTAYEQQYWATEFLLFARGTHVAPQSALAKAHLANVFFHRGDIENANRYFEDALRLDPANWKNHLAYGLMLFYSQQYDRADQVLTKSAAIAPDDANQYFYQGLSRFNLARYSAAQSAFEQALRYDPNGSSYHFWLGRSLESEGLMKQAAQEYRTELQLHPDTDTPAADRLRALESAESR